MDLNVARDTMEPQMQESPLSLIKQFTETSALQMLEGSDWKDRLSENTDLTSEVPEPKSFPELSSSLEEEEEYDDSK